MPEPLFAIGEVATASPRCHVGDPLLRTRLGLLVRRCLNGGQRRYRVATLRRLVFIGMLQDAGLALDDIAGILEAAGRQRMEAIGRRRTQKALDEQNRHIAKWPVPTFLVRCSAAYDHPATDCKIMGRPD